MFISYSMVMHYLIFVKGLHENQLYLHKTSGYLLMNIFFIPHVKACKDDIFFIIIVLNAELFYLFIINVPVESFFFFCKWRLLIHKDFRTKECYVYNQNIIRFNVWYKVYANSIFLQYLELCRTVALRNFFCLQTRGLLCAIIIHFLLWVAL